MGKFVSGRNIFTKLSLFAVSVSMLLLLGACGAKHMVTMDTKPRLAVKPDKAVLVIVRTTSFGGGVSFDNYIDGKMIGQTQGKCYFMTDVTPGTHYVMAHAENWATAKIHFEAKRIYFLNQIVTLGIWKARTGFSALSAQDALQQINESGCDYMVYDRKNPGEDMSQQEFNEIKADFEKEAKEDPGRHKDTLEYKGFSKI
jgi:hypothetical protein